MISMRHPLMRCAAVAGLAALLSACQSMDQKIRPGTPLAAVQQEYGRPNFTCTRPDGRLRVIWTQQPMGQFAWGTDVDGNGNVVGVEALLNDPHFRRIDATWTAEQVRCEFGPPAITEDVGLYEKREIVWSYRYMQENVWYSLMHVYLGRQGDRVTHYHPGPDPLYEGSNFGDR